MPRVSASGFLVRQARSARSQRLPSGRPLSSDSRAPVAHCSCHARTCASTYPVFDALLPTRPVVRLGGRRQLMPCIAAAPLRVREPLAAGAAVRHCRGSAAQPECRACELKARALDVLQRRLWYHSSKLPHNGGDDSAASNGCRGLTSWSAAAFSPSLGLRVVAAQLFEVARTAPGPQLALSRIATRAPTPPRRHCGSQRASAVAVLAVGAVGKARTHGRGPRLLRRCTGTRAPHCCTPAIGGCTDGASCSGADRRRRAR
jgi:hypothetical protein